MRVSHFFTQPVTLRRIVSRDEYSGAVFASDETILTRWGAARDIVRDGSGVEVISAARVSGYSRVSTLASISVGDVLIDEHGEEHTVVSVSVARSVRGAPSHSVALVT